MVWVKNSLQSSKHTMPTVANLHFTPDHISFTSQCLCTQEIRQSLFSPCLCHHFFLSLNLVRVVHARRATLFFFFYCDRVRGPGVKRDTKLSHQELITCVNEINKKRAYKEPSVHRARLAGDSTGDGWLSKEEFTCTHSLCRAQE